MAYLVYSARPLRNASGSCIAPLPHAFTATDGLQMVLLAEGAGWREPLLATTSRHRVSLLGASPEGRRHATISPATLVVFLHHPARCCLTIHKVRYPVRPVAAARGAQVPLVRHRIITIRWCPSWPVGEMTGGGKKFRPATPTHPYAPALTPRSPIHFRPPIMR